MRLRNIIGLIALIAAPAFGQVDTSQPAQPPPADFESPGTIQSNKFIPAKMMTGSLHKVAPRADNDGLVNDYALFAEGSEFEIPTTLALLTRIREVYAIDALRK